MKYTEADKERLWQFIQTQLMSGENLPDKTIVDEAIHTWLYFEKRWQQLKDTTHSAENPGIHDTQWPALAGAVPPNQQS